MGWKSTTAFLTLTFFGLGSLVYLLLKHNEEDEDFFRPHISKTHIRRVKVPIECIGIVIGHCGNTIKEIEAKSDAKIQIIEDCNTSEDYKICVIKGKPEATQFAESLIHEIIVNQALIETYEMYVPSEACGRIIGKNGDNIRLISRNSNAKIMVSNLPVSPNSLEKKIIIKGTSEQIALAKLLVEQKIEEYLEFRNKMETQVSSRAPRNKQKYLLPAKGESKNVDNHPQKQKFVATSSNGLIEVYVCAIETPDKFWLQMVGPSTVELDKLIEQMTDYYTKDENQERHKLREVKNGQVVAAPFPYDNKWYRAEIQEIVKGSEESDIVLYYVDYGDSSKCKESTVYELRTDFLRLRFQAIECMLAKVKPR
ncbi:hypothetical protein RUM43_014787 [Polyplax serrata]|uniref:Tudor domain-containing protein n=1 Tax=Polyplax serrata TaxID=468196 RepID=A0AAN8PGG9_POLSC